MIAMEVNWLVIIMTGLGTGVGSTIGSYLSNKIVIKHLEKLEARLKQK